MRRMLVDFCENQALDCNEIAYRRALTYGEGSWQWSVAVLQSVFWGNIGWGLLKGVEYAK